MDDCDDWPLPQTSRTRTAMTSLPRGSMTFTAMRLYFPAVNEIDVVPLNASKASASAAEPRALAIFSQESWFGKNACVMQKQRPSKSLSRNHAATFSAPVEEMVFATGS